MKKTKKYTEKEKMWAVEQAVKWPTNYYAPTVYNSGQLGAAGGVTYSIGQPGHYDADVIGRARKLLEFIKD